MFWVTSTGVSVCHSKSVVTIRSLVNARGLHEALLMPVLLFGSETMIWKEKERLRIKAVQVPTSEVCWVLGEWVKYQMHGLESCALMEGLMKVLMVCPY